MSDKVSIAVNGKVTHTFKTGKPVETKPVEEVTEEVVEETTEVSEETSEE